eukprot:9259766-Pyramimonas_sp.AAC.1
MPRAGQLGPGPSCPPSWTEGGVGPGPGVGSPPPSPRGAPEGGRASLPSSPTLAGTPQPPAEPEGGPPPPPLPAAPEEEKAPPAMARAGPSN